MQRLVWIPLLVVLETFLVGMADAQVQRLRQVEVVTPVRHCLTKDHMFRPTDPSCQPGTLCTSWQDMMWFNKDGHFDKGATIATGGVR